MCGQCNDMLNSAFGPADNELEFTSEEEAQANEILNKIKAFYAGAEAQVGAEKALELLISVARVAGMDEATIGLIALGIKLDIL